MKYILSNALVMHCLVEMCKMVLWYIAVDYHHKLNVLMWWSQIIIFYVRLGLPQATDYKVQDLKAKNREMNTLCVTTAHTSIDSPWSFCPVPPLRHGPAAGGGPRAGSRPGPAALPRPWLGHVPLLQLLLPAASQWGRHARHPVPLRLTHPSPRGEDSTPSHHRDQWDRASRGKSPCCTSAVCFSECDKSSKLSLC